MNPNYFANVFLYKNMQFIKFAKFVTFRTNSMKTYFYSFVTDLAIKVSRPGTKDHRFCRHLNKSADLKKHFHRSGFSATLRS